MKIEYYNEKQYQNPFFRDNSIGTDEVDASQEVVDEYVRFILRMGLIGECDVDWDYERPWDHDMNIERNVTISTMFANVQSKVGEFIRENCLGARHVSWSDNGYFVSVDDSYGNMTTNMKFQVLLLKSIYSRPSEEPVVHFVSPMTCSFRIST